MGGYGAGKGVVITQAVAQVPVPMSGIMLRLFLIYFLNWNEHCGRPSFFTSQDKEGHQTFRAALPIRPVAATLYAASDGQLGGIIKMYRDWRISGNSEWLKKMYPKVVESMDYCIITWDPRSTGTLEEPHHNTYDIEFWGPDGMCTSFYLGALKAISEMGKFLGEDVQKYQTLYDKGRKAMETELYDGEYFIQQIKWKGLNAPDPVEASGTRSLRTIRMKLWNC